MSDTLSILRPYGITDWCLWDIKSGNVERLLKRPALCKTFLEVFQPEERPILCQIRPLLLSFNTGLNLPKALLVRHGFDCQIRGVNDPFFALGRARDGVKTAGGELEETLRQAAFFLGECAKR